MVGDNTVLSNVEKLYRLKNVVKGDAARIIQHLEVTGENYEAAWAMLQNRYNNRRLLFCTVFDRIIDYPNINIQNAANIKQLQETSTECIQALKAMGIAMDKVDPFIARILIRKLDREGLLRYEQCVQKTNEFQTVHDVMPFLGQQYLALESVNSRRRSSTAQKTVNSSNVFQTNQKTCMFGNLAGHSVVQCRKF